MTVDLDAFNLDSLADASEEASRYADAYEAWAGILDQTASAHPDGGVWAGAAADDWRASVAARVTAYGQAQAAMRAASAAYSYAHDGLSGLMQMWAGYQQQIADLQQPSALQSILTAGALDPDAVRQEQLQQVAQVRARMAPLQQGADDEVAELLRTLAGLNAEAPSVLPHPMTPGTGSADSYTGQVDPHFAQLIWGSVRDNRIAGREFQDDGLPEMDLFENFMTIMLSSLEGTLFSVKPDALTNDLVVEFKFMSYVAASKQIRGEIRLSRAGGPQFRLVVREGAQISQPLYNLVARSRGQIYERLGNGQYRLRTSAKPQQDDSDDVGTFVNGRFVPDDPATTETDASTVATGSTAAGGEALDGEPTTGDDAGGGVPGLDGDGPVGGDPVDP